MSSENYYILDENNTPQGPYTLLRLRAFYNTGDIKATDLICQEGGEHWITLEALFSQPTINPNRQYFLVALTRRINALRENPLSIPLAVVSIFLLVLLAVGIGVYSSRKQTSVEPGVPAATMTGNNSSTKHNDPLENKYTTSVPKVATEQRNAAHTNTSDVPITTTTEDAWLIFANNIKGAANKGNLRAKGILAKWMFDGCDILKDQDKALILAKESANGRNPFGEFALAYIYIENKAFVDRRQEVSALLKSATDGLKKLASEGDAVAMYNLGIAYANGMGVPEDDLQGFKYKLEAANLGYAEAEASVAFHYEFKSSAERPPAAWKYYESAAKQGLPSAQTHLAYYYQCEADVKRSYDAAVFWNTKAAKEGNPLAIEWLQKNEKFKKPDEITNQNKQSRLARYYGFGYTIGLAIKEALKSKDLGSYYAAEKYVFAIHQGFGGRKPGYEDMTAEENMFYERGKSDADFPKYIAPKYPRSDDPPAIKSNY